MNHWDKYWFEKGRGIENTPSLATSVMPTCPICAQPLETARQREGVFYPCRLCDGRALTLSQIRHVLGDRLATKLLRLMKLNPRKGDRKCPFCEKPMSVISAQEPLLELDACRSCNAVWLDAPTFEALPQLTIETTNSIAMQATEIIAMDRLRELKKREAEEREQARKKKRRRLPKAAKDQTIRD